MLYDIYYIYNEIDIYHTADYLMPTPNPSAGGMSRLLASGLHGSFPWLPIKGRGMGLVTHLPPKTCQS